MANLNISKFFSNEASLLRKARESCIDLHSSDIRAAGNEVEISVRLWLERMLPDTVSVGHGHIIDQESNISPQLDCILRDKSHLPTLFTASDGTEYTPFDSIYAIGEIKSTYYKSSKYIQAFSKKLETIDQGLIRNLIENTAQDGIKDDSLLHHILLGSSDVAIFLNGCEVVKAAIEGNGMQIYKYSKQAPPEVTWKIIPASKVEGADATSEGKHLGFLYYCLLNHIRESQLEGPNLTSYMKELLIGSKSAVISIDPQQISEPERG